MDLLSEISASLSPGEIEEIHIGEHWTAVVTRVEGFRRCGLASNPIKSSLAEKEQAERVHQRHSSQVICSLARRPDSHLASVGMAAINALLPHSPERWTEVNAGEVIARKGSGKRVALVGHFPFVPQLRESVRQLDVLELSPREGDLHASEAPEIIPQAEVVAITSMAFINGTLEGLLALCAPGAYVIVIGPSTPMSPILFKYGIDMLGGAVVEDIESVVKGVEEGMHFRELQHRGVRLVTIVDNA